MLVIGIVASACALAWQPPQNGRVEYNFNPGWKLFVGDPNGALTADFADGQWKDITLPHAFNEDDAFKKDIHDLTTGIRHVNTLKSSPNTLAKSSN
jgi:hypothetical protein